MSIPAQPPSLSQLATPPGRMTAVPFATLESLRRGAAILVGIAFLFAAWSKGSAMATQAAYLDRIALLPDVLIGPVAVLLPTLETAVGVALLIPATRRGGLYAALSLLLCFTSFLTYEVARGSEVACSCYGDLMLMAEATAQNRVSLVRNVLLVGVGVFALGRRSRATPATTEPLDSRMNPTDVGEVSTGFSGLGNRGGFTLTELLVVLGIIALLLSILLPALANARRSAQRTACASNLREVAAFATGWAADHQGYLPLDGEIRNDSLGLRWPDLLGDSRRERYDYASHYGGPIDAGPSTFLVAMMRLHIDDDRLLDEGDWASDVRPSLRTTEVLQCPAAERSELWAANSESGFVSSIFISQGERYAFGRHTTSDYSTNGGLLGYQADRSRRHRAYGGQLTRVRSAAEVALVGDGDGDFMSWTPATDLDGEHVTLADVLEQTQEMVHHGLRGLPQLDLFRHEGRANIAFVDGHVATVTLDKPSLKKVALLHD